MTKPLALVFYEKPLPGQQLVNRLQDFGYRVQALTDASTLLPHVEKQKPMLIVAEFAPGEKGVGNAIVSLKQNAATTHVAVLAYVVGTNGVLQETARTAGADLVVNESGMLDQLPELLDQVLRLD